MMASLQADEDALKDVDLKPFSSKLPDVTDVTTVYEYTKENVCQRETLTDETNSRFSCSGDDDLKSTLQESSSKVSSVGALSDNLNHPDVFLCRMSTESVADKENTNGCFNQDAETQNTEYVYLNRLPGENLGMVLGIEGDQENRQAIDAVVVKSVTPIGAVARSCQGTNRILVGDEIREIDGRPLYKLTHDECITLFQDMPDNVVLTIFRQDKGHAIHKEHSTSFSMPQAVKRKGMHVAHPRKKYAYSETNQDHDLEEVNQFNRHFTEESNPGGKSLTDVNEYNIPKGFRKVDVTICRRDGDNFGLSIVPSYGATCDLYQIKRLVHSGASAQSGLLEVGDRLLACNDHSLKGLTQNQCLNVLKSSGALIELTVLRHTGSHEYTQSAEGAPSPSSQAQLTSLYCSDPTDVTIAHEGSYKLSCVKDSVDITTKQETIEGSNNLFHVNDSTDFTIAHDTTEEGNQLSYVNDLTDFTTAQDTVKRSSQLSYVNDLKDFTLAQDTIDRSNKIYYVNDSKGFTIAQDTVEQSNNPSYSNDSEDVTIVQEESNEIESTDFYVEQDTIEGSNELPSVNDSSYIAFTQNISEGSNTLSRNTPEALTAKGTVNDTQIQENLLTRFSTFENSGIIDNTESIQFCDKNETIGNKNIGNEEKDSLVFVHIPPPGEFSDRECLKDSELPDNQTTTDVLATSVDDLLFQSFDPEAPSSSSEVYDDVLNSTIWDTDNKEHGLVLPHQIPDPSTSVTTLNDSCAVSNNDAFSSRSIEDFADECFSNISNTVIDKLSNYTHKQSSEHAGPALTYDRQYIQEEKEPGETGTFCKPVDHVTILSGTSLSDNDSKSPLFDLLEYENQNFPECNTVPLSTGCDPHHTFNTLIIENSHVSKSHDRDVNDELLVKEETFSPLVNSQHHFTCVSNALENISSVTTPSTVSLDELYPNLAGEKSHSNNSAVTTDVGLTNMSKSGEHEEVIAPMVMKYNEGTLPNIPLERAIGVPQDEFGILINENKREMAEFQSAVTTSTTNPFWSGPNSSGIKADILKAERVSTLHTFEKKENVLDALNSWASEISSNNSADFHNAVSATLDSRRKSNEQSLPEKALVHTTIGVSNDGQEETVIQPMICAKDHQGWQFCIPSLPSQQKNNVDMNNVPDYHAKLEIVNVISSIVSSQSVTSQSQRNAEQSEDLVKEDSIVPTVLSYDHKKIVENVLDAWVNDNEGSSKPSTSFQRAVTGFKISQKHANEDGTSSPSGISQETGYVKENNGVRRQTVNSDLQASTVDKEVSSVLSSTENISNQKTENVAQKSAKDFHDTKLAFMQPEVKERTALNTSDNTSESSTHPTSDRVVLRKTLRQSTDFDAQPDKREQSTDSSSSFVTRRPRSMIVTSSNTTSRFEDVHKSFTTENKPVHTFRPLSALRPLSSSSATLFHNSSTSLHRPTSGSFSSSTFASKISKSEYPKVRQEDGSPFQVDVIQGIVGLGLKVKVTAEGRIQVTEITRGGPVDKDGQIHVGDYILFINSTELTGQTDARVQQILRLLPRGLTKLVVSSALPASSESNLKSLVSSRNSSVTSTQPDEADIVHSTPSSNNDSLKATQRKSHSSKTEDTLISPPVNLVTQAVGSLIAVSEDAASEKIELMSQSDEKSVPVSALVDTSSSVSCNHEQVATGVQKLDLSHLDKETNVELNENLIFDKLQDSTELNTFNIEPIPLQRRISQDESIIRKHPSDFKIKEKLSNQNIEIQNTQNGSNSVAHRELVYEYNTVYRNSQGTSARPSSMAPGDLSQHQDNERADISIERADINIERADINIERADIKTTERESSIPEENLDYMKIPPLKVPPPVAPKPRLAPVSIKQKDDHVDGSHTVWPPLRKTFGDDKLHDHKLSKPAVGDNANTFVSSTAKMFDDKTASSHTSVSKTLIMRQVSRERVEHPDSSMTINTSLLPTQDHHKNNTNNTVSLSQSSTLSRPRTLNYTATVSSEADAEEGATKIRENVDQKSNSVLSPTQLNAALSPRKKSSTDSPTSPPFHILKRHAPILKDEPQDATGSGKNHNIHQSGIYQKTPLALLTNKSPSLVFSKEKSPSLGSKQFVHSANSEHQIKPLASHVPSSVSSKEDVMKQFDLLLDDGLSSDDTLHTSQTNESASRFDTQIAEIKKPVALPRRKLEHKPDELKIEIKDSKELCEVISKGETDQTQNKLQDMKECQQQFVLDNSDVVTMPSETNYLSEDIDTITITKKISESNRESLKNNSSQVMEINETSFTNNSIKTDSTEKFEQLLQLDLGTTDTDTNLLPLQQYPDFEQVEESKVEYQETSENHSQQSLAKKVNSEVNTGRGSEANEIQLDFLEAYAHQFVEELMTKIMDNPGTLSKAETADITEISVCQVLSEEEPPPLPAKEPPVPTSPLHSLQSTDLLINTDSFINQPESHAANEAVTNCLDIDTWSESMDMNKQYSVTKPANAELITNNLMTARFNIKEENMTVIGDSENPLNVSNSNSYNVDAIDINLTSPLDLYSEDSGLAGDEDQDVATDDAISPPSESMVIASHEVKKVPFSLKKDAEIVSVSSSAQEYDNLMTDSGRHSSVSTDDLLGDLIYDNYDMGVSANDVYHETAHPLMSPTPTSTRVTAQHSSTSHAEELLHEEDKKSVAADSKEAESARPVPTPRSRSLEAQNLKGLNTEYHDFMDAAPQYEEEHMISGKLPSLAEKEQHLNVRPTCSDEERLLLDEDPPLSEQAPSLPDEPPPLPDVAPPLPDEAPPFPDVAQPLCDQLPLLRDPKPQFPDQTASLLNQTLLLIDHRQTAQDRALFIPEHEPALSEQPEQPSNRKSSFLEQTQTTQDYEELLLPQTEPSSDQNSFSTDLNVLLPDQATNLLDQVNVKETLLTLEEMKESLPDKPLQVVQETPKILAKTENTTDRVEKVTLAENKVIGGQDGKSSLEKSPSASEHLSHVSSKSPVTSSQELAPGIHKVVMMKGATGVGFCIEGGVGSPKGDMPIFIKRIFKGGPAEKCGQLKVRDEILEVNGVKFHSMRHYEAWNHLKFLDDGAIQITIRRPSS